MNALCFPLSCAHRLMETNTLFLVKVAEAEVEVEVELVVEVKRHLPCFSGSQRGISMFCFAHSLYSTYALIDFEL